MLYPVPKVLSVEREDVKDIPLPQNGLFNSFFFHTFARVSYPFKLNWVFTYQLTKRIGLFFLTSYLNLYCEELCTGSELIKLNCHYIVIVRYY